MYVNFLFLKGLEAHQINQSNQIKSNLLTFLIGVDLADEGLAVPVVPHVVGGVPQAAVVLQAHETVVPHGWRDWWAKELDEYYLTFHLEQSLHA